MGSRSWGILVLLAGALALLLVRLRAPTTARVEHARLLTEERIQEPHAAAMVSTSTNATSPPSALPERAASDTREALSHRPAPPSTPTAPQAGADELCVRLIDAWGVPVAAVGIGLFAVQSSVEGERGSRLQREALTDEEGRACFPAALVTQWDLSTEVDLVRIVALLPLAERPDVELQVRRPVPDELLLTLPPVGALVVHVFDPWNAPARNASVEAVFSRSGEGWRASADVVEGLARFPAVELDTRIELRPTTPDMRARGERIQLAGPTSPGETVEASLRFDIEWPMLRMRVLEENGRPLAWTTLGLRILHGRLSPQPGSPRTDAVGALDFIVYGQPFSEDLRELLLWTERPPRLVRLTLPGELGWPTDLGDVVLRPTAPGNVPP